MAVDAPVGGPTGRRGLRSPSSKLGELWRARELLEQLVRKELKVRYKNSSLGFLWSMLTPALMTVVFSIVFGIVIRIPVEDFAAFFLAGYLLWQFFQNSCQGAIHSIVGNGDLVKKVYFPREVLPLSHVFSQLAHLLLALLVVSPYLIATRGWTVLTHLPATLLAIALLTVFTSGVAMLLAGVNVVFRDLQELFVVLYLVWFYTTPVLYPLALVEAELQGHRLEWLVMILRANPMTWFVEAFRAPLYGDVVVSAAGSGEPVVSMLPTWPSLGTIAILLLWAVGAFAVGYTVFLRRARTFAKEV
ncbi:ABC transporter permease [Nitriliruptor alkaliphilus]|uniref:ABC transporter permease n=1 Tax=Nitriliruptor alkaliphilus TaxID=427918 RepID=UPI0006976563|nr:ABC transporter permease [Nitriliruptor alkaliphilus]